jgi:predicted unusual protein kinase regulating ubiquinone biosynthesis (AarF/ABC1/UbiB family)
MGIYNDTEKILYREIDYRDEADNGARFCREFGIGLGGMPSRELVTRSRDGEVLPSAAFWLRAPYVYTELCAEKVLVMEYVPSIKITNTAKLAHANVTRADREYLADMLGRSYLRQFCCHRFFVSLLWV